MNAQESLKIQLLRKFHAYQYPQLSQAFAAIVGFVIDELIVKPRIPSLTVTADGFLLARAEGEVSPISIGRHEDLVRGWSALLRETKLTNIERIEADCLFAEKIGYFGRTTA